MKFDEFLEKLEGVVGEFRTERGRGPSTVEELIEYVRRRKFRKAGRRHLTSLKGFDV